MINDYVTNLLKCPGGVPVTFTTSQAVDILRSWYKVKAPTPKELSQALTRDPRVTIFGRTPDRIIIWTLNL